MKLFIIYYSLFSFLTISYAQKPPIISPVTLKTSFSMYPGGTYNPNDGYFKKGTKNFRIEGNYRINKFIEPGLYLGYSKYDMVSSNYNAIFIGAQTNFHFMPLLVKSNDFRFDVYSSVKFGAFRIFAPQDSILYQDDLYYDYGIYAGLIFYPLIKLGLFTEYGYGNENNFRFGLTFRI